MRKTNFIRAFTLALLACSLPIAPARAAWDPDGNRVSLHAGEVGEYAAIPFGNGGVLAAWHDHDGGNDGGAGIIHAQALDADGDVMPGWPLEGVAFTNAAARTISLASDGGTGAYVIWLEYQIAGASLMVQRLTETGAVAPGWPAAGRTVAGPGSIETVQPPVASDMSGGVYVGWTEYGGHRLRLLRIGPDGEPATGWPAGGLALSVSPYAWGLALAGDGASGVYTAWTEPTAANAGIQIHRFTSAGAPHPSWPAGGVAVGASDAAWPGLVPDDGGGLYAAWGWDVICAQVGCIACPCPSPLFATHVDANGALVPGWQSAGIQFGAYGMVASDASGGLLVGTRSYNWNGGQTAVRGLAARVRPDGTPAPGWSLSGNPVCSERRQQMTPVLVADGSGGAFAAWIDFRTFEPVLYVTRLTASGSVAPGWPETGSIGALAAVPATLYPPALVSGGPGEAVVLWTDARSGTFQLYAERVRPGPAGPPAPRVGLGFTVTDIRPNPARGAFWATVSLPEPGTATLELFDLAGRVLESRQLVGGRPGVVQMNASGNLEPGMYWLRLRQGTLPSGQRTSIARVAVVR